MLEILAREDVRATFFVVGNSIAGRESVPAATFAEGHELGNHTLTHPRLTPLSHEAIGRELGATTELIEDVVGERPRVFRPPYLDCSSDVLEVAGRCGFPATVQGSVWTEDWSLDDAEAIVEAVEPNVRRGSIIVLHDGRPDGEPMGRSRQDRWPTVAAVAMLVPALRQQGFEFVTVSELLAL